MARSNPDAFDDAERFLNALASAEVAFVLCGGMACILHGVSRTTADLDMAVKLEQSNIERFIEVAERFGLRPRIPEPLRAFADPERRRSWIEEKNAVVFTLNFPESTMQADIFLNYPIPYVDLEQNANLARIGNGPRFRVSSKDHLIAAKRAVEVDRAEDRFDIAKLQELIRDEQNTENK